MKITTKLGWCLALLAGGGLLVVACNKSVPPWGGPVDGGDTDIDGDTDTDSDADGDCPVNSGWPCTCNINGETCYDGSTCKVVLSLGGPLGVCMVPCDFEGDYCPGTDFQAEEQCLAYSATAESWYCLLTCANNYECPDDQTCQYESVSDETICYPPVGGDTDTDGDGDTDSDGDTDTTGDECDGPIAVPDGLAEWEFVDNWENFPTDSFDSYQPGCSTSDGNTAWFEVTIPADYTLDVDKTAGATVGINLVTDCDATSCVASGLNSVSWFNDGASDVTYLVAVETDFVISSAALELLFSRAETSGDGDTCASAMLLEGSSGTLDFADFEADTLPDDCGYGTGPDVWFEVPVPAETQVEFTATGGAYLTVGYSFDCVSCQEVETYEDTFTWTNESTSDVSIYAFVQSYYATGTFSADVSYTALPEGDTCADAIDVDETDLPYTWTDANPLFTHSCAADVCPATSGPDVWHEITVAAGDVLFVEKTAGPAAFLALLGGCDDGAATVFSTDPERIIWQNNGTSAATVYVVGGAVSATSIATLALEFDIEAPGSGDFCGSAFAVPTGMTTWNHSGLWSSVNDYFIGGTGCGTAAGAEVWYEVEVGGGEILTVVEGGATDVTLQVLGSCETTSCLENGTAGDQVAYLNPSATAQTVYVAVESALVTPATTGWNVAFAWNGVGPGDLCIDPIPIPLATAVWTGSWADYMDSGVLDGDPSCGGANGRDVWFAVEVGAGEMLTVNENNSAVPNVVHAVSACDASEHCTYSGADHAIWHNTSGATATVLIAVEAVSSTTTSGAINVSFAREAIGTGDACTDPILVGAGDLPYTDSIGLIDYAAAWPSYLCVPAEGSDVWLAVDVPAGNVVRFSENSSTNTAVYLTDECPATDCLASADEPEEVNWYNSGSGSATVYAVAKAISSADNADTLDLELRVNTPAQGDYCSYPFDITGETMPYEWDGNLSAFNSGFTGLVTNGCLAAAGREVWFEVAVPAGGWLYVANASTTNVAIQVLDDCTTNTCVAAGVQSIFWNNDGDSTVNVLVAVEGIVDGSGALDLTFDVIDIPPTMFGPDAYGYWGATDSDLAACADISGTGTAMTGMADDTAGELTMGIDFPFYGASYDTVHVSSNGLMSFGTASTLYINRELPTTNPNLPLIAPFWDDLTASSYYGADAIYYETYEAGGQNLFQVQFRIAPVASGGDGYYDFSVVLEELTGRIHFCYVDSVVGVATHDDGISATAGIQGDATVGLTYSYNAANLTAGTHIWFVAP